ncbi:MAG: beta-lactamase family protein [Bacteroidetes bacterium]|nr:beta-lactamase family protein [Bacteroidota bacterium]
MNKIFILTVFLAMFLSCGNSTSVESKPVIKAQKATIVSKLSNEQKLIAYKLDTMFNRLNRIGAFNGSILVARSGAILYQKTIGFCNKENSCQLSDSSMFQLASVSKVITATAVLMLYERGQVDLDKPLAHYFPDFSYSEVTIKQLLSHRSGLPNYIYALNTELYQPNYKMSNSDMYSYLKIKNPKAYLKPDKCFNYCNTNYALLALLVEKVSGKTFSQFLKQELFEPLGMKHTATIRDIDLAAPYVTKAYDLKWKPVDFDASDYVLGDKSIYSTAYDLFLFSEALYQNKIIQPATQELAYTAYSKEKKMGNYGYGWRLKDFNDSLKKEVYHNGWWHGYRSSFHRRLRDSLTIVILSNQLNKAAYQTYKVYEILDSKAPAEAEPEDE